MVSRREPHRPRGSTLASASTTRRARITACAFVHDHAAAFVDLGLAVLAVAGALLWLVLLIVTGFSPVALSLGLFFLLLFPSHS